MIDWDGAQIVGRAFNRYHRWIKEAIAIRSRAPPCMNRDEGQYNLSHIFHYLLFENKSIGKLVARKGNYKQIITASVALTKTSGSC